MNKSVKLKVFCEHLLPRHFPQPECCSISAGCRTTWNKNLQMEKTTLCSCSNLADPTLGAANFTDTATPLLPSHRVS